MASNQSNLATAQGLYEDWLEIRNATGAAVDLADWYLTDDPADLRKWRFPSFTEKEFDRLRREGEHMRPRMLFSTPSSKTSSDHR